MTKPSIACAILAALFVAAPAYGAKDSQAALLKEAKVTRVQAQDTALVKAPGNVQSAELEREHGRLVWSFDIEQPSKKGITEVQVNAKTGKIASVANESPAQEAKEKKAENTRK